MHRRTAKLLAGMWNIYLGLMEARILGVGRLYQQIKPMYMLSLLNVDFAK